MTAESEAVLFCHVPLLSCDHVLHFRAQLCHAAPVLRTLAKPQGVSFGIWSLWQNVLPAKTGPDLSSIPMLLSPQSHRHASLRLAPTGGKASGNERTLDASDPSAIRVSVSPGGHSCEVGMGADTQPAQAFQDVVVTALLRQHCPSRLRTNGFLHCVVSVNMAHRALQKHHLAPS